MIIWKLLNENSLLCNYFGLWNESILDKYNYKPLFLQVNCFEEQRYTKRGVYNLKYSVLSILRLGMNIEFFFNLYITLSLCQEASKVSTWTVNSDRVKSMIVASRKKDLCEVIVRFHKLNNK